MKDDVEVGAAWRQLVSAMWQLLRMSQAPPGVLTADALLAADDAVDIALSGFVALMRVKSPALDHAFGARLEAVLGEFAWRQVVSAALPGRVPHEPDEGWGPTRLLPDNPIPIYPTDVDELAQVLMAAPGEKHQAQWRRYRSNADLPHPGGRAPGSRQSTGSITQEIVEDTAREIAGTRHPRTGHATMLEVADELGIGESTLRKLWRYDFRQAIWPRTWKRGD